MNNNNACKLYVYGIGEEYKRELMNGVFSGITDDFITLIDKNPEKRAQEPEKIADADCGFIYIPSKKYYEEICYNILSLGIEANKIIPHEYMDMRAYRDRHQRYLRVFGKILEKMKDIDAVQEWNEYNGHTSLIIRVRNSSRKELRIIWFAPFIDEPFSVIDVRSGKVLISIEIKNNIGSIVLPIESDCQLLRITCSGFDIPHIRFEVLDTKLSTQIESIFPDYVREQFKYWFNALNTNFSFHENDYLLFRNFQSMPDIAIIDCGASCGQSVMSFLYNTTYMKIYCFEPNPICVSMLRIIEEQSSRVRLFPYGVSDEVGHVDFYSYDNGIDFSGSFAYDFLRERFPKDKTISSVSIKCVTVDSLENELGVVHFVKLDVEGYEYRALLGMKNIIEKYQPVLLIERNMINYNEIRLFLNTRYNFFIYDYQKNILLPDNSEYGRSYDGAQSLNYWCVPKNGTISKDVNTIMDKLCVEQKFF